MVSAISRVFGWIALFGPGSWVAAQAMRYFGMRATGFLYTEVGVVVGLTNILLPFMVLSIAASRAHLDERVLKAAASLGATPRAVFWQIELPLNLPGIIGGVLIVFSLAITNFATAALLGGSGREVIAYEIYTSILTYHQLGVGAALSVLLLVASIAIMMIAVNAGRRADRMDAMRTGA
jgi:ABC-type spermidine/putrescine transport system permease subunit I